MSNTTHTIDKSIKTKKDDRIRTIHEYGLDFEANTIYLDGREEYINEGEEPGVEFAMANRFIRNLDVLTLKSSEPILVKMKTCGGDWKEGMAIHNAIKACPNKITILVYTHARSMSSLILQAADKRVMMPDSEFMFHGGTESLEGTHKQFKTEYRQSIIYEQRMLEIYIDAMKLKGKLKHKSRKFIEGWLNEQMNQKEDVYLSAKDAVKYGFADEVFGADGVYDWGSLLKF